jgi:hypothetical protein
LVSFIAGLIVTQLRRKSIQADIIKLVVVPIDESANSLSSLDYLNLMFGSEHHLKVNLCSVLPALPPIIVEESRKNRETAQKLKEMEKKCSGDRTIFGGGSTEFVRKGLCSRSHPNDPSKKKDRYRPGHMCYG